MLLNYYILSHTHTHTHKAAQITDILICIHIQRLSKKYCSTADMNLSLHRPGLHMNMSAHTLVHMALEI